MCCFHGENPQDVSNLRGVLQARRDNAQQQFLATLTKGCSMGSAWAIWEVAPINGTYELRANIWLA